MSQTPEVINKFRGSLEPYIKPREQVNYIRRILALQLGACSHGGVAKQPLALADGSYDIDPSSELKGLRREYIEALAANVAAHKQFEDVRFSVQDTEPEASSRVAGAPDMVLDEQLHLTKIQHKRQRLLTVRRHLDLLAERPASTSQHLDYEQIFQDVRSLPSVPSEVLDGIVADHSTSSPDLTEQSKLLERTVLRSKLHLKGEEKRLSHARSNKVVGAVSTAEKLAALHATRNELIGWIESELDKSPGAPAEEEQDQGGDKKLQRDQSTVAAQLVEIKDKYARYVESRKELLQLVSRSQKSTSQPSLPPSSASTEESTSGSVKPTAYLLTSYIQNLLSVSTDQKANIAQKSHMKTALSRQRQEACQTLGHLAEESQLLPAYPLKDSLRRRSGLWNELTAKSSDRPDLANRIRPWVFAADSSKIATLEAVAETVEVGQVALEGSMHALREIDHLMGRVGMHEVEDVGPADTTVEDVWLSGDTRPDQGTRKHTTRIGGGKVAGPKEQDVWSALHGNLGLIGQEV